MEFERSSRKRIRALPLTALIDVMFILIIFFMLTTSFMRIESLELNLPSVTSKTAEKSDVMHLFIQADGNMLLGQRKLDQEELTESLSRMFKKDPNTRVMLLTADGVTMQQLVNIMDRLYMVGGRSLFVRKWESAPASAQVPAQPVELLPSIDSPTQKLGE
jgi:biopolymer transport protein ExbD